MSSTMFRTRGISALALAAAVAASWSGQAFAQAQTGTGGGPSTTITAPNTSSVGQTVPRPGGGANNLGDRETRTANEKKDDQLMRGICIGCSKQ